MLAANDPAAETREPCKRAMWNVLALRVSYYWSRNDYTINSHDIFCVKIVRAISN